MKLFPPLQNWKLLERLTQLFGFNPAWYAGFGIPGHNGWDLKAKYGEPVLAMHDGYIQRIEKNDISAGNNIKLYANNNSFGSAYLHLSKFNDIMVAQQIKAGQIIGFAGNSGGVRPPPTPSCPECGTHLHIGIFVPGRINEYKCYVDPAPRLFNEGDRLPYKLVNDLWILSRGDDVSFLQTCLKLEFPELPFEPISYFGNQTRNAVSRFQQKYLLSPTAGYCGPKTRRVLNQRYSAY